MTGQPQIKQPAAFDDAAQKRLLKTLGRTLGQTHNARVNYFETHISRILVCGEFAYKFRRPVSFAFADFSTLAQRRDDCKREWRLNQRTAKALYLGVVNINGTIHAPEVNGNGPTIDVALKMRRFKQSGLLDHMAATQRLSTELVAALGQHLGEFMGQLPPLPNQTESATRLTIDWLDESFDEIEALEPSLARTLKPMRRWGQAEHNRLKHFMAKRRRDGFYRDGHGDLHLGNLVRFEGRVMAFDALEFNDSLRQTDTVNDIAFTFMDLLAFERADLAWTLMDAWCEQTGDYDGLKLLRFYTLYRAVVRAKVALLTHHNLNFKRYWQLAQRLIGAAHSPRLILLTGLSGSGKSTVAAELMRAFSGVRLRADVIRKHHLSRWRNDPARLYSKQANEATYAELARLARVLLTEHMTVIVDATFLSQNQADRFTHLAASMGIKPLVFECQAPVAVLRRRIAKRQRQGNDPSDATLKVLEQQRAKQCQAPVKWPVSVTPINTNTSCAHMTSHIQALARAALKFRLSNTQST